jgi:hypothetical protein
VARFFEVLPPGQVDSGTAGGVVQVLQAHAGDLVDPGEQPGRDVCEPLDELRLGQVGHVRGDHGSGDGDLGDLPSVRDVEGDPIVTGHEERPRPAVAAARGIAVRVVGCRVAAVLERQRSRAPGELWKAPR